MVENRREALERLATASPLEITAQLEQFELYDMKSSQEIIDEVYQEFQSGEHMTESVLKPVMMSVIDGLLEATSMGRAARKKGLTASRVVQECEQFTYDTDQDYVETDKKNKRNNNIEENDIVNLNMTQKYDRNSRKKYEDQTIMKKYKEERVIGEKTLVDEYTNKRNLYLKKNNPNMHYNDEKHRKQAQPDHIVPIKQIHDNLKNNYALDDSDIKKIANIEGNLAVTSAGINQAKKEKSNAEYLQFMEKKGMQIDETTKQNMLKLQSHAEKEVDKQTNKLIAKNIIDAGEKGQNIRGNTFQIANEQVSELKEHAVGNVILFIIKPIYFELKDSFKNGISAGVSASTTLEALKIRFGRIKDYVVEHATEFLGNSIWDFVKGFVSSLIEGIISLFVGVFKQVLKVVKEGIKIFVQSAKILFGKESKNMTPSQKGDAIIKLLGGSVIAIAGIGIEALLNKIGIGEPWSVVLSTLLSGIVSALFMYLLDKIDLFSVKAEQRRDRILEIFAERINDIRMAAEEFNTVAIETLRKQHLGFTEIQSEIQIGLENDDIDSINAGLYKMADFFNIELPYSNTKEFVDYFDSQDVIKL